MSYNGSGTFVINTSGQPVVTGTVISSTAFNALTADLGTGLSTAITKDGQTITTAKIPFAQGMSAAVASNFAAGTVAAPAIYLSTDTGTGLYRIGANNDGFAINGAKVLDISSSGLAVTGVGSVTTGFAVGGATPGTGGLAFPATAVAVADANTLDDYEEASFTGTLTGCTTSPTTTVYLTKIGNAVIFHFAGDLTGTSNASGNKTITGMPAAYFPARAVNFTTPVKDNGGAFVYGQVFLDTSGVFQVTIDAGANGFTATGTASVKKMSGSYTLA